MSAPSLLGTVPEVFGSQVDHNAVGPTRGLFASEFPLLFTIEPLSRVQVSVDEKKRVRRRRGRLKERG